MKAKVSRVVAFLVSFLIMGVSMSYADPVPSQGYPAVDFLTAGTSFNIGIVGKYEASSFTQAEAESISGQVASLVSTVLETTLGTSSTLTLALHDNPSDLAGMGFYDADELAAFALTNYKLYGLQVYVFLDVSRTSGVAGSEMGHNLRVDVWIGDAFNLLSSLGATSVLSTLDVTGNYLYVTSIEIPEKFLTLTLTP